MRMFSKHELNRRTAQVLAGVCAGETVLITEHGVPRWRIETVGGESDPIARLRAQGRVASRKQSPMPWPDDWEKLRRGRTPAEVDAAHENMRDGCRNLDTGLQED